MKIQAINFKTPIKETNISFKDSDISTDKLGEIQDVFICTSPKIDPKKELKGDEIQKDSISILSWANLKQQEAKRKYAEAERIWENPRQKYRVIGNQCKGFLKDEEGLDMYVETNINSSKQGREIRYYCNKPFTITEFYDNGKQDIYIFSDDGKIKKLREGQETQYTGRRNQKRIDITEGIYTFSPDGHLLTCKQRQEKTTKYDEEFAEYMIDHTTIDTVMTFDIANNRPYLKEARTGIKISPEKEYAENHFRYDENGKLIEAR